ncbi:MAG TPA: class I SAM-dependent methyltransferase [Candidatus Binatia bacterium]|nr:class I SAM-dependent methyltransferase [Candidatus Binatia bacterium]
MNQAEQFYPELHAHDEKYSAGEYHMPSLLNHRILNQWLTNYNGKNLRILDVGCGKGLFARDFVNGIRSRSQIKDIEVTGTDLVESPGNFFAQISPRFRFVKQNLDGNVLPFGDQSFDFLSCNQVLEHIFQTEKLVREFHRVLDPNGLCLISVPNISAWVNRILFLFAGQPLGSELGLEKVTYGFWPTFMQKKLEPFHPSGHIRDFTPRGLKDLARHCGFETAGWWKQSKGPIARLGKWAGRNLAILLRPAETKRG